MNTGEAVFFDNPLGNQDGVFEVVTIPRHKRDTHILPKRQLTHIDRRPIGKNVSGTNHVTGLNQGALVDAGILVRPRKLGQGVDVHTRIPCFDLGVRHSNNDSAGVDAVNDTAALGNDADTRIARHVALHSCTHKRLFSS